MAEKTQKNLKQEHGRHNLLILLAVFAILTVLGWLTAVLLWGALFTDNPHFILRNVELRDTAQGYWSEHRKDLIQKLDLKIGIDNLFSLNLRALRRKLLSIPAIESCEVGRVLPDTLVLRLVERIPRASLNNPRSRWVVDSEGVIMPRNESMPTAAPLPVITGFSRPGLQPESGKVYEPVKPALELLMTTIRNYPDISIIFINISDPDKLVFALRYRNQRLYKAIIPCRSRMNYLLGILQSTIISIHRSGDSRSTIDLSYTGDAVLRQ